MSGGPGWTGTAGRGTRWRPAANRPARAPDRAAARGAPAARASADRPYHNYLDRSRAEPPPLPGWYYQLRARVRAALGQELPESKAGE
jgi:hypothetical protein